MRGDGGGVVGRPADVRERARQQLLLRPAYDLAEPRVDAHEMAGAVGGGHPDVCVLERKPVAFLGIAKLLFEVAVRLRRHRDCLGCSTTANSGCAGQNERSRPAESPKTTRRPGLLDCDATS